MYILLMYSHSPTLSSWGEEEVDQGQAHLTSSLAGILFREIISLIALEEELQVKWGMT
jgi:hypothetical protein